MARDAEPESLNPDLGPTNGTIFALMQIFERLLEVVDPSTIRINMKSVDASILNLMPASTLPDGFAPSLILDGGDPQALQAAELLKTEWAKIKVRVEIEPLDVPASTKRQSPRFKNQGRQWR
jgi:hypothetical protein